MAVAITLQGWLFSVLADNSLPAALASESSDTEDIDSVQCFVSQTAKMCALLLPKNRNYD